MGAQKNLLTGTVVGAQLFCAPIIYVLVENK